MDTITCPAPLEMLRRGSPVVTVDNLTRGCFYPAGVRCTVLDPMPGCEEVHLFAWSRLNGQVGDEEQLPVCNVAMDLTDTTGRAHAVWWVAEWCARRRPACRNTSIVKDPRLYSVMPYRKRSERHRHRSFYVRETFTDRMPPSSEAVKEWAVVPALGDLDPTDDARLPDGSRRVDALALKAVVEHLLSKAE